MNKLAEKAKVDDENQKLNKAQQKSIDQIQLLKKLIGSKFEEVDGGPNNQLNQATVAGGLSEDLKTFGKDLASPTVLEDDPTIARVAGFGFGGSRFKSGENPKFGERRSVPQRSVSGAGG